MKGLLPMVMVFLCAQYVQAQSLPPKKASKIIVLTRDTGNTLLNKIAGVLFDKGYTIETKDETIKAITTKQISSKNYGTVSKIRVRINDTSIVFTSQIALNSDRDILGFKRVSLSYMDVDYSGAKKSANREAWNELDAIAKMFGNNILYSK